MRVPLKSVDEAGVELTSRGLRYTSKSVRNPPVCIASVVSSRGVEFLAGLCWSCSYPAPSNGLKTSVGGLSGGFEELWVRGIRACLSLHRTDIRRCMTNQSSIIITKTECSTGFDFLGSLEELGRPLDPTVLVEDAVWQVVIMILLPASPVGVRTHDINERLVERV
jgi:hypothetical protein